MTRDEMAVAIATPEFEAALRGRVREVLAMLEDGGVQVPDSRFDVLDVPVRMVPPGERVTVDVGVTDGEEPVLRWKIPRAWLTSTVEVEA